MDWGSEINSSSTPEAFVLCLLFQKKTLPLVYWRSRWEQTCFSFSHHSRDPRACYGLGDDGKILAGDKWYSEEKVYKENKIKRYLKVSE